MISAGPAEPDGAYHEATAILSTEAPNFPYSAVIVDEAQDMGEQALRNSASHPSIGFIYSGKPRQYGGA